MPQEEIFDKKIENTGQETEEDILYPIGQYTEAVIWATDWTTETLWSQLKRKNIELNPRFQRRDAWNEVAKSRFIESLILGLPVPQIILAEKKDKKGNYIVIDGKQRLLTIMQFYMDNEEEGFKKLKLKGLEILSELNDKGYENLQEVELDNFLNALDNQSIRTVVIKNWPNEQFLYTVFLRLNTGSLKLSPQELRQALHPGDFIDFADEFAISSESIKEMLGISRPDYRMRDVELVIRFFAFKYFITDYNGKLKNFFDDTVNTLNIEWNDKENQVKADAVKLNSAIKLTLDIFTPEAAFSKYQNGKFRNNFNRAIYDIMVYYFSKEDVYIIAKEHKEEIKQAFIQLCISDAAFLRSFETSTKSMENTFKRLSTWGKKLVSVLNISIEIPTLLNDRSISLENIQNIP